MNAGDDEQAPAALGGWRLVELLGRGGMGEVWRAEREGPGGVRRRAALKRMLSRLRNDGELLQRFMAEARISARLEHPNIVQVLDFGDNPEPYLVFEYVEGISASELLQEASQARVKLPAVVAAFICAEVASGLDYAHRKRDEHGRALEIVHRDVSPHNVLLSVEGAVKIGDFGVARAADNTLRTRAGIQIGKLVYMAPEQAAGEPVDGRADVFSLGVVLWELLTLKPLFPRDDAATTLKRLQSGDIPAPSTVEPRIPPALDQIVMTALATRREQRFASAGAFAQALRGFVHSVAPGFDSSELIRILHKIAPSIRWHVVTPAPVDPARANAPVAMAALAAPVAAKAMPAMVMPAMALAQPPSVTAPAAAPNAAPQATPASVSARAAQPPAPSVVPKIAPASPAVAPVAAIPSASAAATPGSAGSSLGSSPPTSTAWTHAAPSPRRTNATIAIVLSGVVLSAAVIAVASAMAWRARPSLSAQREDEDEGRGDVSAATPVTPLPGISANPIRVGTNALALAGDVPSPSPIVAEPAPPSVDAGAETGATVTGAAHARATGVIQRLLSQNEPQFVGCVVAPSGTHARVTLRLQYDGPARIVRFVDASSQELPLSLEVQQCLKNAAQRAVTPPGIAGTVTVRWSFVVHTRSTVGLERSNVERRPSSASSRSWL